MNKVQKMIYEICREKGISFSLVSKDWIMILEKDHKVRYLCGYKFGLNDHAIGNVCDDKYALYEVLNHFSIPVSEYKIVFSDYDKRDVLQYFQKNHHDIVVKVNDGTCGNGVFHVTEEERLFSLLDELLIQHYSVSLSPFYAIRNEYRFIVLDHKIELCYGKKRAIVVGDGKRSLYELLCEFNPSYFTSSPNPFSRVLDEGEVYSYSWQHNLSKGAIPFVISQNHLQGKLKDLALEVSRKLNLRFASIDLIECEDGSIMVLEVNSGVMIQHFAEEVENGEEIAKKVYSKAIDLMFS